MDGWWFGGAWIRWRPGVPRVCILMHSIRVCIAASYQINTVWQLQIKLSVHVTTSPFPTSPLPDPGVTLSPISTIPDKMESLLNSRGLNAASFLAKSLSMSFAMALLQLWC